MEQGCEKCGAHLNQQIQRVACGNTCRECGRYRYFEDEPYYLYLLTNVHLKLHKVGIGTVGKDKNHLQKLIKAGWTLHGIWHENEKHRTFKWEEEIFRRLKIEFMSTGPESPGFVGRSDRAWIESISSEAISVTALARLISIVVSEKN